MLRDHVSSRYWARPIYIILNAFKYFLKWQISVINFYLRTSTIIFMDTNMWVEFKWTLSKKFSRPMSLAKDTNDRHPFNSGNKLLVSQCLWMGQSHYFESQALKKQCIELLIVYLCFMRSVIKKTKHSARKA